MPLNWVDYIIIFVILASVIISIFRGFVREVLSVLAWVVAIWVAFTFAPDLADRLTPYLQNITARLAISYFILFMVTLFIAGLMNFLLAQIIGKLGLGLFDNILGVVFGFVRGVLLVAVMLAFASLLGASNQVYWQQSSLVPYFAPLQQWLLRYLPTSIGDKVTQMSARTEAQRDKIVIVENQ